MISYKKVLENVLPIYSTIKRVGSVYIYFENCLHDVDRLLLCHELHNFWEFMAHGQLALSLTEKQRSAFRFRNGALIIYLFIYFTGSFVNKIGSA